jgi:hypothetical protein
MDEHWIQKAILDKGNLIPSLVWRFEDWITFKRFVEDMFLGEDALDWAFRGHAVFDWRLDSSLDRLHADIGNRAAETYLEFQFRRAAHHHLATGSLPQTTLEWWATMQHYGTPTRLLDFTKSPYVACFFALEAAKDKRSAIWAIDCQWLRDHALELLRGQVARFETGQDFDLHNPSWLADYFDQVFVYHSIPMVVPVEPPRANERLLVQQGLFLCPGAVEKGFEWNLLSHSKMPEEAARHIIRIELATELRKAGLYELHLMNISRASLFHGLDGYARSLGHKVEVGVEPDHIARIRKMLTR